MTTWTTVVQTVEWTSTVDPSVTFTTALNPTIESSGGGAVDSVNGKTGAVTLDHDAVGAASAAQGALADTAVQPDDLPDPTHHRAVALVDPSLDLDGGDFTQVPLVTVAGSTWTTVPRAATVGFEVAVASGANVGVWEITASGPCTRTTVMGQDIVSVMSGAAGAAAASVNLVGQNDQGGVSIPAMAATSLVLPLAETPADVRQLVDGFQRPMVIFSRFHQGGDPAWPDGDPITDMVDHETGAVNLPLYDDAFVLANGELHLVDDAGTPTGDPFPVSDPPRPIVDGIPWNGGTILAVGQSDWENNGPWDLSHNGTAWVATRPTALNGWVSGSMVVEGMPFWIGSGNRHRLRGGVWTINTIAPTDSSQGVVDWHRNRSSDTIYTPGDPSDYDGEIHLSEQALDELAARTRTLEDAPASGGNVTVIDYQGAGTSRDGTALAAEARLIDAVVDLPALAPGDRLRGRAWGTQLNNSGGGRTYTYRVKIGASTVVTYTTPPLSAAVTARDWAIDFDIIVTGPSALSGSLSMTPTFNLNMGAAVGTATENVSSAGVDLDFTVQSSSGGDTQSVQLLGFHLERVAA